MEAWRPDSWRKFPIKQQPTYADVAKLDLALAKVKQLPPLVAINEISSLTDLLQECCEGRRFLIQGGDCAERFADCTSETIENKLKILLQMSLVLTRAAKMPTVRVARIAGQYSKPRSSDTETVDGKEVFAYRGDNVNSYDPNDREPDPNRIVLGYFHSASTINYARALINDGLADLRTAAAWDMHFVKNKSRRTSYEAMAKQIVDSMEFIETCGVPVDPLLKSVDLFTSHEGLHLAYEEAMTVEHPKGSGRYYNTSAHFIWIGDRTRQLDHAHIEYFRGIENPIGIKVGPTMKPEELVALVRRLNPTNKKGKITLITRFGASNATSLLPPLIAVVQEAALNVVWTCDAMHGNTHKLSNGLKTRSFDAILTELDETFKVHIASNTYLGGVHFELTGDNVTECIGGPQDLTESDLPQRYSTYCDPRLNYAQSIEIAFKTSEYLQQSGVERQNKKRKADECK